MVWFLLVETETVPMGWAPYEPMMPAAQGLDTRSWLGGGADYYRYRLKRQGVPRGSHRVCGAS